MASLTHVDSSGQYMSPGVSVEKSLLARSSLPAF